MNAMDTVTNAMYAKWQWETFRDRLVRKELTYSTAVQDYFKLVDKMNRTQKELKKGYGQPTRRLGRYCN